MPLIHPLMQSGFRFASPAVLRMSWQLGTVRDVLVGGQRTGDGQRVIAFCKTICFLGDEGHIEIKPCLAGPSGCSLYDRRFVRRGIFRPVRRNAHSPSGRRGRRTDRQIEFCVALVRLVFHVREGLAGREGYRRATLTSGQYLPPLGSECLVAIRFVVLQPSVDGRSPYDHPRGSRRLRARCRHKSAERSCRGCQQLPFHQIFTSFWTCPRRGTPAASSRGEQGRSSRIAGRKPPGSSSRSVSTVSKADLRGEFLKSGQVLSD